MRFRSTASVRCNGRCAARTRDLLLVKTPDRPVEARAWLCVVDAYASRAPDLGRRSGFGHVVGTGRPPAFGGIAPLASASAERRGGVKMDPVRGGRSPSRGDPLDAAGLRSY